MSRAPSRVVGFAHRARRGHGEVGFTTRHGGVSRPPWDDLDLAGHVGDARADVDRNRHALLAAIGPGADTLHVPSQVHGADVAVLSAASGTDPLAPGPTGRRVWDTDHVQADALVSDRPGEVLAVCVADCVPVALLGTAVAGVAHAGRRGLTAGVLPATVAAMAGLGATDVRAWIGPSICGACYEVPAAMRDEVVATLPEAAATSRQGTPALDLGTAAAAQLVRLGCEVVRVPGCTRERPDLFSHRRDGVTGRTAAFAWLGPR